ncbi:MAG: hypothetical protein ACR2N2_00475 [Acidimicrobiia bacterium]
MTASDLTDQQLVDAYEASLSGADVSSPGFSFERSAELANELEQRGFYESPGVWNHTEKGQISPTS